MSSSGEDANYPKSSSGQPITLEQRASEEDGRRFSPSTGRNKDVVRATFLGHVLRAGHVLEIASGTGEHGAHITDAAGDLHWTYSDIDPEGRISQTAWRQAADHDRLNGPLTIDTTMTDWGRRHAASGFDAVFCANMIHIAPFEAALGMFRGAGELLSSGGVICLYGPFSRNGEIAPSNARFKADLQRRDPAWGVRDLEQEVAPVAIGAGFVLRHVIDMPANNLTVVFEKN